MVGLLLTSTIVLANFTTNIPLVLTILSIASFAQGLSNISWTMLSEVAPREMVGLAGGVFNFFANLSGIITPLIIGFIVSATGSYNGGILFVSLVALGGALSYIFIVGKIERIQLKIESKKKRTHWVLFQRVDKPSHSVSVLRAGAHECQIRSAPFIVLSLGLQRFSITLKKRQRAKSNSF